MKKQKLSRLKLLGLMSAFAGPLLIATVLFWGKNWFEFSSAAHGHLLAPGQTLHQVSAHYLVGPAPTPLLDGRWLLVSYGDGSCNLYCEADLFKMRQSRLVLGRDLARVRTVYLLAPQTSISTELEQILSRHPALSVYALNAKQPRHTAPDLSRPGIYIVDPLGNIVIYYEQNARSRALIKDLKHLLKVSKIG